MYKVEAIGQAIVDAVRRVQIYVWPLEARLRTADGQQGSLHAKVAVADAQTLLISSANLTEYAMTLNMELGLLIHSGPAGRTGRVSGCVSELRRRDDAHRTWYLAN